MMKKVMTMVLSSVVYGLIGCAPADAPTVNVKTESAKVLIAYYSWSPSGNTRYVAQQIQKATGGTLFEIKPKTPYPSDYDACVDQAKNECRKGFKPELSTKVEDFSKYDVIFVGSPNWWGTMAPPVLSFLNAYDFTGKKVLPFFTHGGGGMQNCETDIRKNLPKAEVLPAKAFSGGSIRNANKQINDWINSILTIAKSK